MEIKIKIPEEFKELFNTKWRHIFYYGGRASGKSTSVALALLIRGMEKTHRVLCVREYQNSIADSVHKLLSDLISKYGMNDYVVTRDSIKNKRNGTEFIFRGLRKDAQAIKSMEGVTIVWCEEAQSISQESIDVLIPTIRTEGSQVIWTMNPLTESDPAWMSVANNPGERTFVLQVNSDVLEKNGLLSLEMIEERERTKQENPDLYRHVWLGEPMSVASGSVFGKMITQAEEDNRITSVPYDSSTGVYTVWDLGISDSTAVWFFQLVGREIHIIDHLEGSGEALSRYINEMKRKPYDYITHFLPHDAKARELQSGMSRVEFFANAGVNNVEVLSPNKMGEHETMGIELARAQFSRVWIDKEKCARGLQCIKAYHYAYDEKNKMLRRRPEHDWSSNSADAYMYMAMAIDKLEKVVNTTYKTYVPTWARKE